MREDGFTNEKPTKLGNYLYKIESWKIPSKVILRDSMGGWVVDFLGSLFAPVRLSEIPADALWKKIN